MLMPKRYDVLLADLNPAVGSEIKKTRPVVIVSPNEMNRYLETVVVCPLTTKIHPRWRSRIQVEVDGKDAEIAADQIRTISKKRLIKKIDEIDSNTALRLRLLISEMYGE
jgi:mRNA interferase MazF